VAQHLALHILREQKSANIILPGDLFHAESAHNWREAIDVTPSIHELLTLLAHEYQRVLFVPGNHCLRRLQPTENPWEHLDPPRNVIMPRAENPIVIRIGNARLLLGNIFYDGHFLNGASSSPADFKEVFDSTTDGEFLLRGSGSVSYYREMTQTLAASLLPDIDALVTHVPPTPAVATWRVADPHEELPEGFPGRMYFNPERDREGGLQMGGRPPEYFRHRLNRKVQMLGSNVFEEELGAKPKNGITLVFGHHHRNEDEEAVIRSTNVRLVSHQPVWKG
jgi:hypothetical protein